MAPCGRSKLAKALLNQELILMLDSGFPHGHLREVPFWAIGRCLNLPCEVEGVLTDSGGNASESHVVPLGLTYFADLW